MRASPPWAASRNGKPPWPRLRGWSAGALQSDSAEIYGLQSCLVCSCESALFGLKPELSEVPNSMGWVHLLCSHCGLLQCITSRRMGSATAILSEVEPGCHRLSPTGKAMQLLESMPARQVVPNAFIMGAAAAACREAKGCVVQPPWWFLILRGSICLYTHKCDQICVRLCIYALLQCRRYSIV